MICPKCGKEYNEKMTCCISCGTELVPKDIPVLTDDIPDMPPIIPDIPYTEYDDIPKAGFVRGLEGHSEYPPEPEKPSDEEHIPLTVKRKTRSAARAVRGIGSFAASAVMFALIILSALSATVRLITDSGKITEFTSRLDVMSLPAAQTVMLPGSVYNISSDATIQEAIFVMSSGTGLTREDIRRIYESSTVQDFLAAQLNGYAEFIRDGEIPERLTSEKLKEVFSENIGLIGDAIGKPLTQHDIDLAFEELELTEPVLEAIAPSKIESSFGSSSITLLRLLSSLPVTICEAVAAAAMLIVLWAINRRSGKVLGWGGGAVLAGGAAVLTATFLCCVQVFFTGQDRFVRSITKCVTDVIAPDLYRIGGTLAALGIVMLLWSATLKRTRKT
ncbi:MAG: hypothetical protein K2H23_05505 [Oscillospiraceae bacterium]|nr:hypothetical protein [Oscillospiraceae bacterium]